MKSKDLSPVLVTVNSVLSASAVSDTVYCPPVGRGDAGRAREGSGREASAMSHGTRSARRAAVVHDSE